MELMKELKIGDYETQLIWNDDDPDGIVLKNIILRVAECLGQELSIRLRPEMSKMQSLGKEINVICCNASNFNKYTNGEFEPAVKDISYTGFGIDDGEGNPGIFMLIKDGYDHYKDNIGLDTFVFGVGTIFVRTLYEAVVPTKKQNTEKFASGLAPLLIDCVAQNISSETIYDEEHAIALKKLNK